MFRGFLRVNAQSLARIIIGLRVLGESKQMSATQRSETSDDSYLAIKVQKMSKPRWLQRFLLSHCLPKLSDSCIGCGCCLKKPLKRSWQMYSEEVWCPGKQHVTENSRSGLARACLSLPDIISRIQGYPLSLGLLWFSSYFKQNCLCLLLKWCFLSFGAVAPQLIQRDACVLHWSTELRLAGGGVPWEDWYPKAQTSRSLEVTFAVHSEDLCRDSWFTRSPEINVYKWYNCCD